MGLFGSPNIDEMIEKNDIKGLVKSLRNKDYMIRKSAAEALIDKGEPSSVEPFIEMMEDQNDEMRRIASQSLGISADQRAIPALITALNDSDVSTRINSARALGNLKNEDAIKPLQELLMLKSNDDLLITAAESLGRLRAYKVLIGTLKNEGPRKQIIEVLSNMGDKAVDPLVDALNHDNGDIRASAAIALGKIGSDRSIEPMSKALERETLPFAKEAMENALKALNQ